MLDELLTKFDGILAKEDLEKAKADIESAITEAVEARFAEQLEDMARVTAEKIEAEKQALTESLARESAEYIKELRAADAQEAAEYINTLTESHALEVAEYMKVRETALKEELEDKFTQKIDELLESVVTENFKESTIEQIALNETYRPIVEGLQKILTENFLAVDSEGSEIVRAAQAQTAQLAEEVKSLKDSLKTLTESFEAEKSVLLESNKKILTEKLLIQKTQGLSETQTKQVLALCEGMDPSTLDTKLDTLVEGILALEFEKKEDTLSGEQDDGILQESFKTDDVRPNHQLNTFKRLVNA